MKPKLIGVLKWAVAFEQHTGYRPGFYHFKDAGYEGFCSPPPWGEKNQQVRDWCDDQDGWLKFDNYLIEGGNIWLTTDVQVLQFKLTWGNQFLFLRSEGSTLALQKLFGYPSSIAPSEISTEIK